MALPSSTIFSLLILAADSAWYISPLVSHCEILSAIKMSALARIADSSSCLLAVSEPTAVIWVPSLTSSARSNGISVGVVVTIKLQ